MVLAVVVALGVVASSMAQGMFSNAADQTRVANISQTVTDGR